MRPRCRAAFAAPIALLIALLAGCAADSWSTTHATPALVGTLGAGFLPANSPSPEATVHPPAGSWADAHPSVGYRVALVTAGDDKPTNALVTAVTAWADDEHLELRMVAADDRPVDGLVRAMAMKPDLIVSAGNDLVDALATVSASHLDQQFLVVGAEIAEPTANVTAVDWSGASFRGSGLETSSQLDAATFTAARCGAAIRAGTAAVLKGLTGVVLWLD